MEMISFSPFNLDNPYTPKGFVVSVSTYGFDGAMDDVRIYDYSLSAKEIEDLFIGTIPRPVNPEPVVGDLHVDTMSALEWEVINAAAPTAPAWPSNWPGSDPISSSSAPRTWGVTASRPPP